ncbi:MAG: YqeG family HAD IIIA-type phosphatase [Clostridia bacterium]
MILYPKTYIKRATEITVDFLRQHDIKALILDVDNTVLNYERVMLEGIEKWAEQMQEAGIKLCIVSNSNHEDKVKMASEKLGNIWYTNLALKPFKKGFKKAIEYLNLPNEQIAAVGDQIFTDVIGANRLNIYSILVEPIDEKDISITRIKRPLENWVINRYKRSKKK